MDTTDIGLLDRFLYALLSLTTDFELTVCVTSEKGFLANKDVIRIYSIYVRNISHFVGECKRVKSSAARLESDNSSVSIATAGSMRKRERET